MTKPVLSKPARESNIELLRIVSMFFVLILHADYLTLDVPSATDFHHNPANFLVRTLADSFCLCAVNVFVMISGWFGIRGSVRGFCKFAFQAIYFLGGTYIVFLIAGKAPFSWGNVAAGLGLCRVPWFVASYAVLYVLAPVLNGFVQSASRRQLGTTLLCFFAVQTVYTTFGQRNFFMLGYTPLSLIGLYLLARYLRLYGASLYRRGWLIYFGSVAVMFAGDCFFAFNKTDFDWRGYTNPFVITAAAGLLMAFSRIRLRPSRVINFVAASAFAVYLLHTNSWLFPKYINDVHTIYAGHSGVLCLLAITAYLVGVYLVALLADQPRKLLWRLISPLFRKNSGHQQSNQPREFVEERKIR